MKKYAKKININAISLYKINKKYKIIAFFIIIILALILYFKYLAMPIVLKNTESQIQSYATKSINYAVADTMNQGVNYGDLINVAKDKNDNVSFIEANSVRINLLSKTMSKAVMSNFLEFSSGSVPSRV